MKQIAVVGNWLLCSHLIDRLIQANFTICLSNDKTPIKGVDLIILKSPSEQVIDSFCNQSIPWLVWNGEEGDVTSLAYQVGALAVFPADSNVNVLYGFIERFFERVSPKETESTTGTTSVQRRFQRGDIILLEPNSVVEVELGVIAQTMIHQDGAEVLLGLFGPLNLIVPHPADTCFIQLVAHTNAIIHIRSWKSAIQGEGFMERMRSRLQQMEAWAAMQARPHLDQRILGILSLLGEQFGEPTENGELINVRLTHHQLASAVGSTRATITRTLSDLKVQGRILTCTTPDGERFCLTKWEPLDHGLHAH